MRQPDTYSRTQIILHWLVAVLVLFQIFFHEAMEHVWHQRLDGTIPNVPGFHPHAFIGIVVGLLIIWRLVLRFKRGAPPPPKEEHIALQYVASATHWLFYAILLLMTVSGAVAWTLGIPQPAAAHGIMAKVLIALVVLHFIGAMAHHFWFKTNVLNRMLGRA